MTNIIQFNNRVKIKTPKNIKNYIRTSEELVCEQATLEELNNWKNAFELIATTNEEKKYLQLIKIEIKKRNKKQMNRK